MRYRFTSADWYISYGMHFWHQEPGCICISDGQFGTYIRTRAYDPSMWVWETNAEFFVVTGPGCKELSVKQPAHAVTFRVQPIGPAGWGVINAVALDGIPVTSSRLMLLGYNTPERTTIHSQFRNKQVRIQIGDRHIHIEHGDTRCATKMSHTVDMRPDLGALITPDSGSQRYTRKRSRS